VTAVLTIIVSFAGGLLLGYLFTSLLTWIWKKRP